jgi:hypothetical protein
MKTQHIDQAAVDLRYAEKIRARAAGTAPVFVAEPPSPDTSSLDPDAVDARYRAKLAARAAAAKAQAEAKPGPAEAPKATVQAPAPAAATQPAEPTEHEEAKQERSSFGQPRRGR